MRALTPKRILTNPFFSVKYFTLFCCINHATIVLQELRLKYRQISTTFYKKTHNNLINSIKSKLDSLYHTDITKILQLIY